MKGCYISISTQKSITYENLRNGAHTRFLNNFHQNIRIIRHINLSKFNSQRGTWVFSLHTIWSVIFCINCYHKNKLLNFVQILNYNCSFLFWKNNSNFCSFVNLALNFNIPIIQFKNFVNKCHTNTRSSD